MNPVLHVLSALLIVATVSVSAAVAADQPEDPKAVIATFAEAIFVEKDFDALAELMHEDYIQPNPLVPRGRDGFQSFFEVWFAASPDFGYELEKIASEGDTVWVHGTCSGTHDGERGGVATSVGLQRLRRTSPENLGYAFLFRDNVGELSYWT